MAQAFQLLFLRSQQLTPVGPPAQHQNHKAQTSPPAQQHNRHQAFRHGSIQPAVVLMETVKGPCVVTTQF